MESNGIGEFVRRRRIDFGLTQAALADKAGISRARVAQIEGGRVALPGADHRRRLAVALNVRHVDLLVAAGELTTDEIDDVAPLVGNDPDVDLIAESWEYLDRTDREVVKRVVRRLAESSAVYTVTPIDAKTSRER